MPKYGPTNPPEAPVIRANLPLISLSTDMVHSPPWIVEWRRRRSDQAWKIYDGLHWPRGEKSVAAEPLFGIWYLDAGLTVDESLSASVVIGR